MPVTAHEASWVRLGWRLLAAVFGVVGADVDRDQEHPAAVGVQEGISGVELRSALVMADPAVDHRAGGLARAAQLDELERGMAGTQGGVDLIGVAVPGFHAGADRVGLDALGQRVAQREVIGGRGLARGRVRTGGREGPGAGRDRGERRDGDDGQREAQAPDAGQVHRHLPETAVASRGTHRDHASADTSLNARSTIRGGQARDDAAARPRDFVMPRHC